VTPVLDGTPSAVIGGLGAIGGSIGLGLRARGWDVLGFDRSRANARRALHQGAVSSLLDSLDELAGMRVDIGVSAVPPRASVPIATAMLRAGVLNVTDTCSVKQSVVRGLAGFERFVGGHPMAGSEKSGMDGARADLFVGANWLLTPGPLTAALVRASVEAMVRELGARPITLDAADHERGVAYTSHLPHIVSAGLALVVRGAGANYRGLIGPGFRDTSRLASGSPALWTELLMANRVDILPTLRRFRIACGVLEKALMREDADAVRTWLDTAKAARDEAMGSSPAGELDPSLLPLRKTFSAGPTPVARPPTTCEGSDESASSSGSPAATSTG
jgi:prephenate dehydrogenase